MVKYLMAQCGRQKNNLTKGIHILIPRAYEYVRLHGKRSELRLQIKLRLLIIRSLSNMGIILDYPRRGMGITLFKKFLNSGSKKYVVIHVLGDSLLELCSLSELGNRMKDYVCNFIVQMVKSQSRGKRFA